MSKKYSLDKNTIFLGIDYGLRKIGIAIGQCITLKASPLKIIVNKRDNTNWEELDGVIRKWMPKVIVLGYPNVKKENDFIKALNCFNDELCKRYGNTIEITKFSEDLSTEESKVVYREIRKSQYKISKKPYLDDLSASIILQSWLNENMIS